MAVLISTGSGFRLVPDTAADEVLRPAPTPLRRPHAGRRPAGRPKHALTRRPAPVVACRPRPDRHPLLRMAVLTVLVAAVVVGLGLLYGQLGGASTDVPQRTTLVQVRPGESLWDLASRFAPHSEPAAVVDRIRQLNGLDGAPVLPGQPLEVPDGR